MVVGAQALLFLPRLDGVISALRLLSEESVISELLPTLRIEEVQNSLSARGYVLRFASSDSRSLDRSARVAALCQGTLCVGNDRHFVAYRDRRAPLGYDAAELSSAPGTYILYTAPATQAYFLISEISPLRILSRLPLLPAIGGKSAALRASTSDGSLWLLLAESGPQGLLGRILSFLWRRGISATVALPDVLPAPADVLPAPAAQPSEMAASSPRTATLIALPANCTQVAKLLLELPGITALRPLNEQLAVELGYVHPTCLPVFARLFSKEQRYLFLFQAAAVLVLPATPFVPIERLVELRYVSLPDSGNGSGSDTRYSEDAWPTSNLPLAVRTPAFEQTRLPLRLTLRLLPQPTPSEPPVATLVPWSQARVLGRLLCLLPPPLLGDLRASCLDEGILLLGDTAAVTSLPLGQLFYAAAEAVLVPLGMALVPRLRDKTLRAKLGVAEQDYAVFLPGVAPFRLERTGLFLAAEALVPRLLTDKRALAIEANEPTAPVVVNDSLGLLWPLWGK